MGGRSEDGRQPPVREAGADPRGGGRRPIDRLRPGPTRGRASRITNRHDDRATALAEEVGCRTVTWAMRASTVADVIINCTPVGMHPERRRHAAARPRRSTPPAWSSSTRSITPRTRCCSSWRASEAARRSPGVDMFVRQAARQFKLYTGQDAPLDVMRDAPEAQARTAPRMNDPIPLDRRGLALVGCRGTGKSTVGRILAERLGRPFVDADVELEARSSADRSARSSPRRASRSFRDWEEQRARRADGRARARSWRPAAGVVLREANRRLLRDFGFVVWLAADPAELAAPAASRAPRPGRPARPDAGRDARRDRRRPRGPGAPVSRGGRRRRRDRRTHRRRGGRCHPRPLAALSPHRHEGPRSNSQVVR